MTHIFGLNAQDIIASVIITRLKELQPLPRDINPEQCPVVGLIAEALGLRGKVLGLIGWNAALMDVDGHSFFKGLNIRDQG